MKRVRDSRIAQLERVRSGEGERRLSGAHHFAGIVVRAHRAGGDGVQFTVDLEAVEIYWYRRTAARNWIDLVDQDREDVRTNCRNAGVDIPTRDNGKHHL